VSRGQRNESPWHEYKEELVNSAKMTFEKLCSGVEEANQAPVFDHDDQDPFLDSEYTIQALHFVIKNLRVRSSHNLQFSKLSFRNSARRLRYFKSKSGPRRLEKI
jgi:hypothetical protein